MLLLGIPISFLYCCHFTSSQAAKPLAFLSLRASYRLVISLMPQEIGNLYRLSLTALTDHDDHSNVKNDIKLRAHMPHTARQTKTSSHLHRHCRREPIIDFENCGPETIVARIIRGCLHRRFQQQFAMECVRPSDIAQCSSKVRRPSKRASLRDDSAATAKVADSCRSLSVFFWGRRVHVSTACLHLLYRKTSFTPSYHA